MNAPLDIAAILAHVKDRAKTKGVVHEAFLFERVESTNRVALDMASSGLPGGVVVLAEAQTAGKGRLGRRWFAPPGRCVTLSLLLRPCLPVREYPLFSPAAAVGIIAGLQSAFGVEAAVKWPNDILIGRRKLGGILLETGPPGDQGTPLAIGVGINVNLEAEDFPAELQSEATALQACLGRPADRTAVAVALIDGLCHAVARLEGGGKQAILREAAARCVTLGKRIRVSAGRKVFEGWAEGIEADGALRIRLGDRSRRRILIGEITHLREEKDPFPGIGGRPRAD